MKQFNFVWEGLITEGVLYILTLCWYALNQWFKVEEWKTVFQNCMTDHLPFFGWLSVLTIVFSFLSIPFQSFFHYGFTRCFNDRWCRYVRCLPYYVGSVLAFVILSQKRADDTYRPIILVCIALGLLILFLYFWERHRDKIEGERFQRERSNAEEKIRSIRDKLFTIIEKITEIEDDTQADIELNNLPHQTAEQRKREMKHRQRPLIIEYIRVYEESYRPAEADYNSILIRIDGAVPAIASTTISEQYDKYKSMLKM